MKQRKTLNAHIQGVHANEKMYEFLEKLWADANITMVQDTIIGPPTILNSWPMDVDDELFFNPYKHNNHED